MNVDVRWGFSLFCQVSIGCPLFSSSCKLNAATGAHVAAIIGGAIGQFLNWQWIFKFAAITNGFCLLFTLFFLPETLYIRDLKSLPTHAKAQSNSESESRSNNNSILEPKTREISRFQRYSIRMSFGRRYPGRTLKLGDFFLPYFKLMRCVRFENVITL